MRLRVRGRSSWSSCTKLILLFLATPACEKEDLARTPMAERSSEVLVPDLRIDGYAADLVPVSWMGVAQNGTIALVQMQDANIQFFDSGGVHLGSFGRQGSGPGEFRRPTRGGWVGDTLWISDTELRRVTLISPERDLVRTLPPLAAARPSPTNAARFPTFSFVFPYGLLANDLLLTSVTGAAGDPLAEAFQGTPLLRVTSDGVIQDLITEIPQNPCSVNVTIPGGSASAQVPFCASPEWAVSPDGARLAILTTDGIGPEGGKFRVSVVDSRQASEIFSRSYPFEGVPIPRAAVDSAISDRAARAPIPELRQAIEGAGRRSVPPVYPPVRGIVLGADGRLLVGLRGGPRGNPWLILNSEGDVVGHITVPQDVTLRVADADHVWGLERDELGVESVVRFSLPGGPQRP